jgi:hypothetical protein
MAGFAMRNHRVSADRRLATTEGFGREEIIRAFSADADIPDDAILISPDFARIELHLWPWLELQKDYISTERSESEVKGRLT